MKLKDKYQLQFQRKIENWKIIFVCNGEAFSDSSIIASKLNQLHILECKSLIEEIDKAQRGEYFEEYFVLNRDEASDCDEIRIVPPNVIINFYTKIPLQEMKVLLKEWLAFVQY